MKSWSDPAQGVSSSKFASRVDAAVRGGHTGSANVDCEGVMRTKRLMTVVFGVGVLASGGCATKTGTGALVGGGAGAFRAAPRT